MKCADHRSSVGAIPPWILEPKADEDGETIVLHKEEVDFIEATIKEQGW